MVSAHFPFFPNPFIAIAIAGAVTIFSVGVALGHPLPEELLPELPAPAAWWSAIAGGILKIITLGGDTK